ncbi:MAG: hypothetical protein U0930_08030 [Pirellulales bacterium]
MLFTYRPVPHKMDQMHEFVSFIFSEVWCKAPDNEYSLELFEPNPALHQIMVELFRRDSAGKLDTDGAAYFFYENVNAIFSEFKLLNPVEIVQFRTQFEHNNRIEELCRNEAGVTPTHYDSLDSAKSVLNDKIYKFFNGIYNSGFFDLAFVRHILGSTLSEYYREFVDQDHDNNNDACPFCGIMPLDGEFDSTRDAFDHFLPKSVYPYNSLNLRNLVPSCHKCNSGHKLSQDPINDDKTKRRRRAFYPFSRTPPGITITVTLMTKDWSARRTKGSINVRVGSTAFPEEASTWNKLYGIEERYEAKCNSKNGGIYWQSRILNECKTYNLTPREMLEAELKAASNAPWVHCNFLKKAFLECLERSGLLDSIETDAT